MGNQNATGMRRLLNAFRYSWAGFRQCYRNEEAFRQELMASLLIVPLGLWLGNTGVERALLVGSWIVVPIVELLNSALEAIVDRVGTEHHALSGQAKDMGSAAVLLSIGLCLMVWGLVLLPRWL